MREIRCRHCGYYLLSVEADRGRLCVTCRRCKRRQTVDLGRDERWPAVATAAKTEERDAEREAVAWRT